MANGAAGVRLLADVIGRCGGENAKLAKMEVDARVIERGPFIVNVKASQIYAVVETNSTAVSLVGGGWRHGGGDARRMMGDIVKRRAGGSLGAKKKRNGC